MLLSRLVGVDAPHQDPEVAGLTLDSRQVRSGHAFCALAGDATDGHQFAAAAVKAGAVAILAERPVPAVTVPVVVMPDLRERLSMLAGRFYGAPSATVECIGVTGTNGKTSISHHIAQLFRALGEPAAVGGTLGWGAPGALRAVPGALTTADAVTVQQQLAMLREQGFRRAALEVSSHALAQHRVAGVAFRIAVFANLSRDHLDYHGTMERYEAAKRKLFAFPSLDAVVVNLDDPVGQRIAADCEGRVDVWSFGRHERARLRWTGLAPGPRGGTRGRWMTPAGCAPLNLPLIGAFSAANAAAAIAAVTATGRDVRTVAEATDQLKPVPGRMEFVHAEPGPTVVIDFAHTPDALAQVLEALRPHCLGRLSCVVGCGGDRDRGKRPVMARVAETGADRLWLTSDNPRSEDPAAILDAMIAGLAEPAAARVEPDRTRAVTGALAEAGAGDVVLVAGKGHEDYQEIAGQKLPYSDHAVVRAALGVA